jgi:hypothetical protein
VTDRAAAYLVEATAPDGAIGFSLFNGRPRAGEGQPLATSGAAGLLLAAERPPAAAAGWVAYCRRFGPYLPRLDQPANVPPPESNACQQHLALARLASVLGEDGHRRPAPQAADADLLKWSAHRSRLFRHLKATQAADGSWTDQFVGPAYNTALVLTTLQLDNNYLPAYSR